jgi:hypothetical protein
VQIRTPASTLIASRGALNGRRGRIRTMAPKDRDTKLLARQMFDLYQTAKDLEEQNLRRRYPDATEEEIAQGLRAWKHHRPGAEHGDVSGPVRVRELPDEIPE